MYRLSTLSLSHINPLASPSNLRPTISSSTSIDLDDWSIYLTMPISPSVVTPDEEINSDWSSPLETSAPTMSQGSSSPTDFAFELPSDKLTPLTGLTYTPSTGSTYSHQLSGYSSASSFSSSASGSYGGGASSFSSTDALPAISRDFSRPNVQQAKRPATAGGLLQSRAPLGNFAEGIRKETIQEGFENPFNSTADNSPYSANGLDPRYSTSARRASEGQGSAMPPPSWPVQANQGHSSAPAHTNTFDPYQINQQAYRSSYSNSSNRPQTSDGLPSFGGPTPLPSARSVVGPLSNMPASVPALQPPAHIRSSYEDSTMPFRDRSAYTSTSRSDGDLTFVPIGGPVPKKRPRRRFDEIERLYRCGWGGCEKSYGTLNHLNAHVAMQQHGEKRLPSEFKDMRKAWRKKKRDASNNAASSSQHANWARGSISSGSEFDRRDSTMSTMSSASASRFPTANANYRSANANGGAESRPTTGSSVASSSDGRSFFPQQSDVPPFGYGQNMPAMPANMSGLQSRRDSAPQHVSMPFPSQSVGFRQNDDGVTPTPQNPFPLNFSMNYSMNPNGVGQQQHQQQQHHQPYPHHPHHPQQMAMRPGTGGFPFQTLTQPMPMVNGPQYGQFAFQR